MKKYFYFAAALMMLVLTGCDAQKRAARKNVTTATPGVEETLNATELFTFDPNANGLRATANYNGFDNQSYAANRARAELAKQVGVLVTTITKEYAESYTHNEGSEKSMSTDNKLTEAIESVSEELIEGRQIVKMQKFRQQDGTLTVYVCVEISVDKLVNNVRNNKKLIEAVNENAQAKIDFKEKKFEETTKEEIRKYNVKRAIANGVAITE